MTSPSSPQAHCFRMFFKRKWKIPQPQKQVNFDFNGSVETFGSESESLVHGSHRRCPVEPAIPDEALFLALGYLQFMGLSTVRMVCKSLRDAVDGDALLWCHLLSECPLSLKVTDSILLDLVSKVKGTLESLVLIDSWLLTDSALYLIAQTNPHITNV
ncbi:hypothetical protein MRB53_029994 [Persea americana]|uniref:Uncharacterized protein n=1 Tax=Persea americana TaxID=3435 RepID=A0ACC2KJY7_PERAE|nr:hypothetical protein MRB53_029994 [Persea americana]